METKPQPRVSSNGLEEPGIQLGIPGYRVSGLSTTPQMNLGIRDLLHKRSLKVIIKICHQTFTSALDKLLLIFCSIEPFGCILH